MTPNHNNDGPATLAEPESIIMTDEEVKEIVEKTNDYVRRVADAGLFQPHDIYKNPMVKIDEKIIGYIHWLVDGCNDAPGGFDESFFMTQEQVDERLRKFVNRCLRDALHLDEHIKWENEILAQQQNETPSA
jgi:hypothetical protein